MANFERALSESYRLYRDNPAFILPHLLESILTIVVLLSAVFTIALAVGVHSGQAGIAEQSFIEAVERGGAGLVAIILLTALLSLFIILLIKAAATVGVISMAEKGYKGEKTSFRSLAGPVKHHLLDMVLFWIAASLIFIVIFGGLLLAPAAFIAAAGPQTSIIAASLFFLLTFPLIAVIFYLAIMFTPQYIVVSGGGVKDSMKKSLSYLRSNTAAVLTYIAIYWVVNIFMIFIMLGLSLIPDVAFYFGNFAGVVAELFFNLISIGIGLVVAPFFEMVKTGMIMDVSEKDTRTS